MHKVLALALSTPILLIGAAQPADPPADPAAAVQASYRPCRPGPGDDRCIQLYERGVRAAYARWRADRREDRTKLAMRAPAESQAPRLRYDPRDPHCEDAPQAAAPGPAVLPTEPEGETRGM